MTSQWPIIMTSQWVMMLLLKDAHCEITMGNDVARDIHCDVTVTNDTVMCTYHGIAMHYDVAMNLSIMYSLLYA